MIRDRLVAASTMGPTVLKEAQQVTGVKYCREGWLFDPLASSVFVPPYCMYVDYMHGYVSAGGVGQYELNQTALQICVHVPNIQLPGIDAWVGGVQLPRGFAKLPATFFQDRVVDRAGAHIKAFAAECLTAIILPGFFIVSFAAPLNIVPLQKYIDCFVL